MVPVLTSVAIGSENVFRSMSARKTEYPSVVDVPPSPFSSVSVMVTSRLIILFSEIDTEEMFSSTAISGMSGRRDIISIAYGFSFSASKMYSSPPSVLVT